MPPWVPVAASLVTALLTFLVGLLTIRAAWHARRVEHAEVKAAHILAEQNSAYQQVSDLAGRYKDDADWQREMRRKDQADHDAALAREREIRERERLAAEGRWSRQVDRCRKITDTAASTITDLMRYVPPNQRRDANHVLDDMAEHRTGDHPES